jgi:acetolactate synthase-1/2/3 large subunit
MATVTAFSHTVTDPAQLPAVLGRAAEVFASRRPRPVHVSLPLDVIGRPAEALAAPPAPAPRPHAPPDAVAAAAARLAQAQRPLILLGGGAQDAGGPALALARRLAAPIGLTINGRGAVPGDNPLCLGSALSFPPVGDLLRDADATVLVGAQLSDLELWGLSAPLALPGLVRIDIDPGQLQRRWPAEVALHGDAAATLTDLLAALARHAGGASPRGDPGGSRIRAAHDRVARARARLTPPPEVARFAPLVDVLDRVLPADRIVAGDSTQPVYAANHLLPMARPRSWLMPIGYGCLGCALPMAIGAKLAAPERPVLALAGDGGFLFTVQELATLRDLGLPVVTLVYNNHGYGEIREAMDHARIGHLGTDAALHDLTAVARGFGIDAVSVATLGDVEDALVAALRADGPTVIEYVDQG